MPLSGLRMDAIKTQAVEPNRSTSARMAIMVWIASGIYLFATSPTVGFISWQALVFFVPGILVASLVMGLGSYLLTAGIQRVAVPMIARAPAVAPVIGMIGLLIFVGDFVIGFLAARAAFKALVG